MASGGTTISHGGGVPGRYAAALYGLADENGLIDETSTQLRGLTRLIEEAPDFRRLIESPLVDVQQAVTAVRNVLTSQGFSDTVTRFVGVVAANRRLSQLRAIIAAFNALVAEKRGIVTAHVASAHRLSDVQREQLRARLIEAGYGQINIEEQVDPSLLGGLVVRVGARLFDSSLKSSLQRLQYAMKGTD